MALISEADLTTLTNYLGNSQNQLYGGLGATVNAVDKSRNYMNRAKVFIRGGSDVGGVDVSISSSSCLVSAADPADATVTIPDDSRYYINETLYSTSGVTTYTFNLVSSGAAETISVGEAYKATVYIDADGVMGAVKTPAFVYYSYSNFSSIVYPDAPDEAIPLANVLVKYHVSEFPVIASTDIADARQITGYLGLEDDDQMAMFTSFNQDEDTLLTTTLNFSNYYTRSINALRSHVAVFSGGLTFERYYQSRDFTFSQYFRTLYRQSKSKELSCRMGFLDFSGASSAVATSQLGGRFLATAAQFEVYVPRYGSDESTPYTIPAFSAVSFDVYLVKNVLTTFTNDIEAYDNAAISFGSTSSFSSSGYILMDNEIAQYTSKPSTTSLYVTNRGVGSPYGVATHRAGITVYEVEKQSVSITTEAQIDAYDDSVTIATTSDTYIQCAGFGNIVGGNSGLALGVRNVVS